MKKKRVLIHSNFYKMLTGFGKHKKNLLSYLYKTDKYEIVEFSNGFTWSAPELKYAPWENYGSLPDDVEIHKQIAADEGRKGAAGYGAEMIDKAIYELKPDIYLGIEDIWAFNSFFEKPWWNKINCIVHTTLDSLPILPNAIEAAPKIKNYFVWSSFAEKALHKLGHTHIKTIHGSIETKTFFKLNKETRDKLRNHFKIQDNFVIGFVFRNQLRKSVPNLLDGFKLFKEKTPQSNPKLLFHTHWSEGWNIPQLLKEKEIDANDVLTTYFCKQCNKYNVKPFIKQNIKCDYCQHPKSCETVNIKNGVNEQQLNEIYNLMDVYCHPFTSGGQEIPIQEAKLTELITLVTNYSCGEDSCSEESGGLPLQWAEYREPGTQFIKASTSATSICDQLQKVYFMPEKEKISLGKKARQYILDNYSVEIIGKIFEDLFDSLPSVDFNYEVPPDEVKNPFFDPDDSLQDKEWIESLYMNMLKKNDEKGVIHWMQRLKTDLKRKDVLNFFKKVAFSENQKQQFNFLKKELAANKDEKRIAFIEPSSEEAVIIASSLLPSIKKQYPDYKIYFFTKHEYVDLINSHPDLEKTLYFSEEMNDPLFFEGKGDRPKYFDIVFAPYLSVRNNYTRNSEDKISFNLLS
jgi:glycosyltransferase involved in cell wall biosynthesis